MMCRQTGLDLTLTGVDGAEIKGELLALAVDVLAKLEVHVFKVAELLAQVTEATGWPRLRTRTVVMFIS